MHVSSQTTYLIEEGCRHSQTWEVRFRFNHLELWQRQEGYIQTPFSKLGVLSLHRPRSRSVERIHGLDLIVAQEVLENVAAEALRGPRDQDDVPCLFARAKLGWPRGQAPCSALVCSTKRASPLKSAWRS